MFHRCAWLLVVLWPWAAAWSAENPEIPYAAAQTGLNRYLAAMPPAETALYGVPAGTGRTAITLGEPFQVFVPSPSTLTQWTPTTPINGLWEETTAWWFPILVQGEMTALLIVDRMDSEWRAVSFGRAEMAKAIGQVEKQWAGNPNGRPQWIMIPQAAQLLYHIPGQAPDNLTRAAIPNLNNKGSLTRAVDVIPSARNAAAKNIAAYKAAASAQKASP
ncbi:MAG TPA: hypothetical protein DCZ95_15335 [Verrucomicrobia bacterium]|nr:MAG: hypothetical protein A2X46_19090 [Lentisphaerae bacterium GWF2_57_35]HBA85458.1 hypothetical protein [Verrucomicrobiota bacterium]